MSGIATTDDLLDFGNESKSTNTCALSSLFTFILFLVTWRNDGPPCRHDNMKLILISYNAHNCEFIPAFPAKFFYPKNGIRVQFKTKNEFTFSTVDVNDSAALKLFVSENAIKAIKFGNDDDNDDTSFPKTIKIKGVLDEKIEYDNCMKEFELKKTRIQLQKVTVVPANFNLLEHEIFVHLYLALI